MKRLFLDENVPEAVAEEFFSHIMSLILQRSTLSMFAKAGNIAGSSSHGNCLSVLL